MQDVILPRVLDDGTFATLSSLMLFNNVDVLMSLTQDKRFFPELFGRLKQLSGGPQKADSAGDQAWTDLVAFLQVMLTNPRNAVMTAVHTFTASVPRVTALAILSLVVTLRGTAACVLHWESLRRLVALPSMCAVSMQ